MYGGLGALGKTTLHWLQSFSSHSYSYLGPVSNSFMYDSATDKWTEKKPLPVKMYMAGGGLFSSFGGLLVVVPGGSTGLRYVYK